MTQTITTEKNTAKPLSLSIKADRLTWIKETAQNNGISVSELVRRCIDAARKTPKALGL